MIKKKSKIWGLFVKLFKTVIPFIVFLVFAGGAVIIYSELENKDLNAALSNAEIVAEQIAYRVEDAVGTRIKILEIMALRWKASDNQSHERFDSYANAIYSGFPGFQAVNWIDNDGNIRWIFPEQPNLPAKNKNLRVHPETNVRDTFLRAQSGKNITITSTVELLQGGQGFAIYIPLTDKKGNPCGFINGVFRIDSLIEACIPEYSLKSKLRFFISDGDKEIFRSFDKNPDCLNYHRYSGKNILLKKITIRIRENRWMLSVCPKQFARNFNLFAANNLMLFFGVLISAGLSLLVYFLIKRGDQNYCARIAAEKADKYRQAIFAALPSAIIVIDSDYTVKNANKSIECFFKTDIKSAMGRKLPDLIAASIGKEKIDISPCPFCGVIDSVFKDKKALFNNIAVLERPGMTRLWVRFSAILIDYNLNSEAILVIEDITEFVRLQNMLEERKEYVERILNFAPDAIVALDKNHRIVEWNPGAANLFGFDKSEVIGINIDDLIGGDDKTEANSITRRVLIEHESCLIETKRFRKDKSPVDVIIAASPLMVDNELKGVIAIYTDISQIKKAQAELVESEERYRQFIHLSSEAIFRFNLKEPMPLGLTLEEQIKWGYENAFLAECNDAYLRLFGVSSKEELINKNMKIFFEANLDFNFNLIVKLVENNYCLENFELRHQNIDGSPKVSIITISGYIEDGKVHYFWGIQRDITEQKRAQEALTLSEAAYRQTLDSFADAIHLVDKNLKIVLTNKKLDEWCAELNLPAVIKGSDIHSQFPFLPASVDEQYRQVFNSGIILVTEEHNFISGKDIWTDTRKIPIIEDGKTAMVITVIRDITGRKIAEEKIRLLAHSMSSINEAVTISDVQGKILYVNDGFCKMYKCSPSEVLGTCLERITIPSQKYSPEYIKKVTLKGGFEGELINRKFNDETFYIHLSTSILKDENNSILGLVGVARDISKDKEAEITQEVIYNIANSVNAAEDLNALSEIIRSELSKVVDTTNFFIAMYDRNNDSITLPYYADEKDAISSFPAGNSLTARVIKQKIPLLVTHDELKKLISEGAIELYGSICKVWLGVPLIVDKEVIGAVVVQNYNDENALTYNHLEMLQFVSGQIALALQRKRALDAIAESEERYRSVVESSPSGIVIIDENMSPVFSNDEALNIFGYTRSDIPGFRIDKVIAEDSYDIVVDRFKRRQSGELVPSRYEFNIIRKDGALRRVEIISRVYKDTQGRPLTIAQLLDVTEKRLAEEKLRASEELTRGMVTNSPIGIAYLDKEGKIIYENPALTHITGRAETRNEIIVGRTLKEILVPDPDIIRQIDRLLARNPISGVEAEYSIQSGGTRRLELHGAPRIGADGEFIGAVVMFLDLTEYRAMEAHLRHAQKMEAIGALAGGIAHDFNNLLTGIMGNVELALLQAADSDPVYPKLKQMQKSAERAAELTSQLLAFGRQRMEQPKPANLNSAVDEAVDFIRHTIDKRIEVQVSKEPNLWVVRADLGQMNQALINLMINAADAMSHSGVINLNTSNIVIDNRYCNTHSDARPGDYVKIMIQDTGCGIPQDFIDRIFEPFFTTKPIGKGTGLGLAMVYGIVKGHDGWIEVYSELGKGTAFKIYLPRVIENIEESKEEKNIDLRGGVETILLVDDEDVVRALGSAMLERFGYKIILAEDGMQAVEIFKREHQKIGLVILDVTMPKKSGRETLIELLQIDPNVQTVISSGFDRSGPVEELLKLGAKGFVQKPYRIGDMLQTVRGVLDMSRR